MTSFSVMSSTHTHTLCWFGACRNPPNERDIYPSNLKALNKPKLTAEAHSAIKKANPMYPATQEGRRAHPERCIGLLILFWLPRSASRSAPDSVLMFALLSRFEAAVQKQADSAGNSFRELGFVLEHHQGKTVIRGGEQRMTALLLAIGVPAAHISVDNVLLKSLSPFAQVEAIPYSHGERRICLALSFVHFQRSPSNSLFFFFEGFWQFQRSYTPDAMIAVKGLSDAVSAQLKDLLGLDSLDFDIYIESKCPWHLLHLQGCRCFSSLYNHSLLMQSTYKATRSRSQNGWELPPPGSSYFIFILAQNRWQSTAMAATARF